MLNIAVVCGGDSGEFEISVKSGLQVFQRLDREKFTPYLIEISRKGWICRMDGREIPVEKNDFTIILDGKKICFDVVFNAIHGTPGEDGKLQGYFDMLGIPYTSSGVTTSALTFNKSFCKKVVAANGIRTANSVHLYRSMPDPVYAVWEEVSFPCFVKPNNGGSSVGMSKVNQPEELEAAIEKAFQEDDEVLVEDFIQGRELTCGVLQTEGSIVALPVTEIISKKDFFDYEAKYQDGLAEEVVPAGIDDDVAEKCQKISKSLYEKLNCRGVVRFDYIYSNYEFWFLEVNTVPGLTEQSIVPKMARADGWNVSELFEKMIVEALKGCK
ncbi:MAG: D-alanine--D-alanine ligase [Bacteroidetes bacterium]|nr:D-alanine--D-alanine ligase [Bacteroidota bacterium]